MHGIWNILNQFPNFQFSAISENKAAAGRSGDAEAALHVRVLTSYVVAER